jgi:hypothetical protein
MDQREVMGDLGAVTGPCPLLTSGALVVKVPIDSLGHRQQSGITMICRLVVRGILACCRNTSLQSKQLPVR